MSCPTSPPVRRRRAPKTKPPTNAAMKPEPPIGSAIPKASPAPASGTICSQEPPTWRMPAGDNDDARGRDAGEPLRPGSRSRSARAPAEPQPRRRSLPTRPARSPARSRTTARRSRHSGRSRRSSPCRTRLGSLISVTTAWPSAASVGARITASSSASGHEELGKHDEGERRIQPRASAGRPIPSRRSGTESSPRSARTSIREASANRTSASVASASSLTVSPAGATLDESQRLRADEQPDCREDHRGRDRRTRDPAGDRREREQGQRDDSERPVHRLTLCHRLAARTLGCARRQKRTESRR